MKDIAGWFIADEDQVSKMRSMLSELPPKILNGWSFQSREGLKPLDSSFIHFGACYVDESDEKSLLSFLTDAAKQASSNYDDPEDYIEGDFFILDLNRARAERRLRIAYGSIDIDEREPYRPPDLKC